MKPHRPLVLGGLAVVVLAVLVAAIVSAGSGDRPVRTPTGVDETGIAADATLSPRVVLFGDTLNARVDVVLDPVRVDPDSVRVDAAFDPFEVVRRSATVRRSVGDVVVLRTSLALRCVRSNCLPGGQYETYDFAPARISFAPVGDDAGRAGRIATRLPSIRVYSRFAALNSRTDNGAAAWQADVVSMPAVSYRFDRNLLLALLLGAAALAALAGVVLAYRAWPRRVPAPAPEPEPPPPPLSPLEQALALLELSITSAGAPRRRRALELVAEELERADWGDRELAATARTLAWSEDVPAVDETSVLAARVRGALPRERDEEEEVEADA